MRLFQKIRYGFCRLLGKRPSAIMNSKIHPTASVGNGAQLVNCTVGRYSYVHGSGAVETQIGAFCSIAPGCSIGGGSHPTDWVSTSPAFYKGKNVLKKNFSQNTFTEYKKTHIGNDVWIGAKCMVKGGITIGDGAVIGMGSVVTHDVPPYEIWAGNPARCIRKRFDDDVIEQLLKSKWWEWSDESLARVGDYFSDPQQMINHLKENNL